MATEEATPTVQMAQCSITGKMVPEDELVTLHGHRVCAEGKAILLERLKAGEALPGEMEKPTVIRRFGCIFLDGLIVGIPFGIINAIVNAQGPQSFVLAGIVSLVSTLAQLVYFGQMHGSSGQTIGKKAGKLRVVTMDGGPITLGTAYVRAFAYVGPGFLSGLALMTGIPGFVLAASLIVAVWGIANTLFALFDRNMQRALHDRIAGTRVVEKE